MEDVSSPILLLRAGKREHAFCILKLELECAYSYQGGKMLLSFLRECRKLGIAVSDMPPKSINWFWALQTDVDSVRQTYDEFPEIFADDVCPLSHAKWPLRPHDVQEQSRVLTSYAREKTITPDAWWKHLNRLGDSHVLVHLTGKPLKWYINRVFCDHGKDWRRVPVAAERSRNLWEYAMTCDSVDTRGVARVLLEIDSHRLTLEDFCLRPALVSENPFLRHYSQIPMANTMEELQEVFDRIRVVGSYSACLCWPICYEEKKPSPPATFSNFAWPLFSEVLASREMVVEYNRAKQRARLVGWRASLRRGWMR